MHKFSLGRNKDRPSEGEDRLEGPKDDDGGGWAPDTASDGRSEKSPEPTRRRLSKSLRTNSGFRTGAIGTAFRLFSGSPKASPPTSPSVSRSNTAKFGDGAPATMPIRGRRGSGAGDGVHAAVAAAFGLGEAVLEERVGRYDDDRRRAVDTEDRKAFDHDCRTRATRAERRANEVLMGLKAQDDREVFGKAAARRGYGNQAHPAFAGDHFLSNVPHIAQTAVLRAARRMPKGAHLHIHYNSCLEPDVLLKLARSMGRMFITSDLPLVLVEDSRGGGHGSAATSTRQNFYLCEIQFAILSPEREQPGNLFSADYRARQTMPFRQFLAAFPAQAVGQSAMDWLVSKLVFGEQEAYDIPQTARGAWERFNGRTRMMKGLFNYESVYRTYTELFLQDLLRDHIQYAEIRPNFMTTNQLWNDEGTHQLDNAGIVQLIVDACEAFKARLRAERAERAEGGRPADDVHFDGIKIIYCTPRSFPRDKVRAALVECLEFKQRWPGYIAGFDLVGEEAMGQPLRVFAPEFLAFQKACEARRLDIPFLFHCGETLDMGTDVDANLVDALVLGAKRIGHGFALPRHPHIMEQMRDKKVCVEVCPISNEILGLTPRIGGHAAYSLLANNVPCTINSDNGTLFQSTLSHDFYQILIGKADMGLFGWRQLAEWSLVHACFTPSEREAARRAWLDAWRDYVIWLLQEYDAANPETRDLLVQLQKDKRLAANPAAE